jgi:16S rRNA (guanine527-N7)-methyltransferase
MSMPEAEYAKLLRSGLAQMGLELPAACQSKLIQYVELLAKWSKAYNLTTVRAPADIIQLHILDSLSVLPFVQGANSIVDVGTGAGLPGIPLAICLPQVAFNLLDSQQKKITFVQHVLTSLQLLNVTATTQRIESWQAGSPVDIIISRAFASLVEFVNLIGDLCAPHTQILAMKGRREVVEKEIRDLPHNFKLLNIDMLHVPGLAGERCLVRLQKEDLSE